MSRVASLIQDMIEAGVSADLIGRTAALLAEREPVVVPDEQAERRRAKDRERKRRRNSAESAEFQTANPPIKETSPRPPKENYPLSSEPSVLRCDSAGEAFSEFFDAYPRRSGSNSRKNAETRFRSALKAGVPAATIIDGAKRYAEHCRATGNEGTAFVKMAEAWINGRLWESDYSIPAPRPPPPRQARRNTALDGLDELERRFSNAPDQHTLRIAG